MSDNDNDSNLTMGQISRDHESSIIDLLIDIQKSQMAQQKSLSFIKNLECLQSNPHRRTHLSRKSLNAFSNPRYVALSYTWRASEFEPPDSGRYQVQKRDTRRKVYESSTVRNCVFDRILEYMQRFELKLLWIDNHSLQQASCEMADCEHIECNGNREGVEVMDLVYKLSAHPVALLSTPIESQNHLETLLEILSGNLVDYNQSSSSFQLSNDISQEEATRVIELLSKVTKDPWWKRGWIFQENYRAGSAMHLLIPHSSDLEPFKLSRGTKHFGDIRGELCISSTSFSYEATRFCLAFGAMIFPPTRTGNAIKQILETAGRYTLIVEKHLSMSPTIFSDINKRDLARHWDQLAIAANCCQYSTLLDIKELKQKNHSFSLSKLALCLLNGELLRNDRLIDRSSQMTVLEFLSSQFFSGFYAPVSQHSLSFNKGCRLTDVELTRNGILTKGHLWKLKKIIQPYEIKQQRFWVNNSGGMLGIKTHKRLAQLALTLEYYDYKDLATEIWEYLDRDAASEAYRCSFNSFTGFYMRMMASELANAIDLGTPLILGCKWNPFREHEPYLAIFICKSNEDEDGTRGSGVRYGVSRSDPSMVFTASAPRRQDTVTHGVNDLDRHVSLEVRRVGPTDRTGRSIPHLEIKSWILGLCFFKGIERTDVLFSWPPGFETISP